MGQQPSPPGGRAESWPRVIVNTITLALRRRRASRRGQDGRGHRIRLVVAAALGVVVVGAGVFFALGQDRREQQADTDVVPFASFASGPTSSISTTPDRRPGQARTSEADTSLARAAAGAEIARRPDTDVSAAAAAVLRNGQVDGRVLVALASLAAAGHLIAVDVPPEPDGSPTVEMGVADVDVVLDWLETQPQLRPDHVEVRRDDSTSFILLGYDSPEPPGLFPS